MLVVKPLTMEVIDWQTWNTTRHENGMEPASRNLDSKSIKLDAPNALIEALSPKLNIAMRQPLPHYLRLVNVGFLVICDSPNLLAQLQLHTEIPVIITTPHINNSGYNDPGITEAILKGNLEQIKRLVIDICIEDTHHDIRLAGNLIYQFFVKSGMKDLWIHSNRETLGDRTFILC